MKRYFALLFFFTISLFSFAQEKLSKLTVEKIMRDPIWIGSSPSKTYWSPDSEKLYFDWNPEKNTSDSLYCISITGKTPRKVSLQEKNQIVSASRILYNTTRTAYTYEKNGDIFYTNTKTREKSRITHSNDTESNPSFTLNETAVAYTRDGELYSWNINTGETTQLTAIENKKSSKTNNQDSAAQQKWLMSDRLLYFDVLKSRKEKKESTEAYDKALAKENEIRKIPLNDKSFTNSRISPDGRFISYVLLKDADEKKTIVPAYVTLSGYTEDIPARSKVGTARSVGEFYIYDRQADTIIQIKTDSIPGIRDVPAFIKDYPKQYEELSQKKQRRNVSIAGPFWSPKGTYAILDIFSHDNKDRWLMLLDPVTGKLRLLDRQHDDAWIGGPGISASATNKGWLNEGDFWFHSEATGYSHLYSVNVVSGEKKALTKGNYEIQQATLSADKKYFYILSNEVHPGEKQFYRLTISNGKTERITTMTGANQVVISPDEKNLAILYSYSNKPPELYIQENKAGGKITSITNKAQSEEFKSYTWRDPELITFKARDSANVYARLYRPANPHPSKPAVIFVHGAGYLQNAHKWWSDYFREYMFHNMLADNGYYVIDVDYRGSAGYGRDWRTGIYRHMGGKDLTDQIDAAEYLIKNFGVDAKRIGIYGGSYGGFITLMALFTTPDVFAAGAALRPVTNWANYNHGYTSNILNEPLNDSISYRKSSPLYFAEGLKNHLLICHGMVDVNVHYQDAVELAQRLIELGKDNWELASYPMEDHGFVEPSSWTDEYKRIFKLFETVLKSPPK